MRISNVFEFPTYQNSDITGIQKYYDLQHLRISHLLDLLEF